MATTTPVLLFLTTLITVALVINMAVGLSLPSGSAAAGPYRADHGGYGAAGSRGGSAAAASYLPYGGGGGGYSPSSGTADDSQKETKYYYGGKYQGHCVTDGLYYRDDTTFVICSNGYPHEQPCPPGTKTSGSPRYQPGYYYGYTDLCSVNLVDYGYGPEYYAPRGYPSSAVGGSRHLDGGYDGPRPAGRELAGYGDRGGPSDGYGAVREADYSKSRNSISSSASAASYGSSKKDVPSSYASSVQLSRYPEAIRNPYAHQLDAGSSKPVGSTGYGQLYEPASDGASGYSSGSKSRVDSAASYARLPGSPHLSIGDKNY
jgi:hypothetical protein